MNLDETEPVESAILRGGDPLNRGTLPPHFYTDPAILEREFATIFDMGWNYVGSTDALDAGNNRIVGHAGRIPVVVTRDRSGELHALVNICRHRLHPVAACDDKPGPLLRCSYHSWTYDMDGSLRSAPGTAQDSSFDKADFGMKRLSVDTIGPWIYVSGNPSAPPLSEVLADTSEFLTTMLERLEGYVYDGRSEYTVKANWKLFVENTGECYHCGSIHSNTITTCFLTGPDDYVVRNHLNAWPQFAPAQPGTGGLAGRELRGLHFAQLWPASHIGVDDVVGLAGCAIPVSPTETRFVVDGWRNPNVSDADVAERNEKYAVTFDEDLEAIARVQESLSSGWAPQGRTIPSESQVHDFDVKLFQALSD